MAGGGGGQDGRGVQVDGGHAAGVADGLVDGLGADLAVQLKLTDKTVPVVDGGLSGLYGADHDIQSLQGVLARGGLAG